MGTPNKIGFRHAAALFAVACAAACGGESNSEKNVGASGSGGSSAAGTGGSSAAGSGGSAQTGSGGSGASGAAGSSARGSTDGGAAGPDGTPSTGGCPSYASFTLAIHIVMNVTWAAGTASSAGSGQIHLWNLAKLTASGTALSGLTQPCGNVLPPLALNAVGAIAAGGSMVLIEVPNSVWDAPSIPKFQSNGTLAGWSMGSAISISPSIVLVGLTMPDPMAAWPASSSTVTAVDADSDGKPGFLAVPRSGGGFVLPPTALGLGGSAPGADQIYLASRTSIGLMGNTTSCDEQAGTIAVTFFDSHVVGCRLSGGQDCSAAQVSFIDGSSPIYRSTGGTFRSKRVADDATCADVRVALPATM